MEYLSERVSNCCFSPVFADTDICSGCNFHSEPIDQLDEEALEFADTLTDELFRWGSDEYNWVRTNQIRKRVHTAIADLRYDLHQKDVEISRLKNLTKVRR